jgi:hypothetical protein
MTAAPEPGRPYGNDTRLPRMTYIEFRRGLRDLEIAIGSASRIERGDDREPAGDRETGFSSSISMAV